MIPMRWMFFWAAGALTTKVMGHALPVEGGPESPSGVEVVATQDLPPKPLTQSMPKYPDEMRRFGIAGEVKVAFVVNKEGRVINPVVVESENPAFDEEAVKAVATWAFKPGMKAGKPVSTKATISIVFRVGGVGAQKQFKVNPPVDEAKLPPDQRYDVQLQLRAVLLPVYPAELRRDRVRGTAAVVMKINEEGRVSEVVLTAADRPEFGLALMAAAEGFRFTPALLSGRPVVQMISFKQDFSVGDLPDEKAERLLVLEKKHPEQIVGGSGLDEPLASISRRVPQFPLMLKRAGVTQGEALVECVIDKEGRACLPWVVSSSAPEFGYAAVQAVNTWLFSPPKSAGKPAAVRVRVPFVFKLTESKAAVSESSTKLSPSK
jgi:TonB family protein